MTVKVLPFFDSDTSTFSYVVADEITNQCAIIDPVLGFDSPSNTVNFKGAGLIVDCVIEHGFEVQWILETHVHADHISAAQFVKSKVGGKIAIGAKIAQVQETFAHVYNEPDSFARDGSQFDCLLQDQQEFMLGETRARAIETPGHTPACMTYVFPNCAFVGDTLFMPESGTARSDFPGGSAEALYDSAQTILSLPDETRLYMCHDYSDDAKNNYQTTVAEQRLRNIHVNSNVSKEEFVRLRTQRDSTLASPRYLYPSIQSNIRAGSFPDAESNDRSYFKIPIHIQE